MADLIKRLEALEAPCRDCDVEIARLKYGRDAVRRGGVGWSNDAIIVPCYPGWKIMPAYTASIDAAMTLVPEGWLWSLFGPDNQACLVNPDNPSQASTCDAATPAIALCIAALRAQEASHDR